MKNFFNKKFSTKTKLISSAISLMLIVCFAITGTVAWLVDKTDTVEDTFTFGKVEIKLIDANNNVEWSATVHKNAYDAGLYTTENNEGKFKLIPGATFDFNPAVQVVDGSEPCYIFVKIEPQSGLEKYTTINLGSGWVKVDGASNIYAYGTESVMTKTSAGNKTTGFVYNGTLVVNSSVTSADVKDATDLTVKVTAYAIQADHLTNNVVKPVDVWALIGAQGIPNS